MKPSPYEILTRKRRGERLGRHEIAAVVTGAVDGSWTDAQLGAFLMAAVLVGLDLEETRALTVEMLQSGESWDLASEIPRLGDKHSTGGVGDKVSLVLAPLLVSCGLPVVMLTGRGLGHTGGTADKLDCIPGLEQALDRGRALALLREAGLAIGVATRAVAPADRRLYALRDSTATVDSLPLIVASILSKKLATGAAAVVFDVKTGDGAFLPEESAATELAELLVGTTRSLGRGSSAWVTDMSQPLGRRVGNACELQEAIEALEGEGPDDLMEVTFRLGEELAGLLGADVDRARLEGAIASGAAREAFAQWAAAQGAEPAWLSAPRFDRGPVEVVLEAPVAGRLERVATRRLGLLLIEAGAGRKRPDDVIDPGVGLRCAVRLGEAVEAGQELARLDLRAPNPPLVAAFSECFEIAPGAAAEPGPRLVRKRVG